MRVGVTLECQECKNRNYRTNKNRHTTTDRLEIKKHCSTCRRHTTHRETR